ncbi:hypothetical protein ALC62_12033 [Cyphomyrmex costatus]|uniref:Uncharacterized protein n=1 Tax=Cyphomyrmex costatus TaxID=456900 RepID=A0A195C9B0_9HYME|nr:hypothetical protein ALC62_12033 [Cyphomyrmex costatus]
MLFALHKISCNIAEPPSHIQTKTLLNLVSNFIREKLNSDISIDAKFIISVKSALQKKNFTSIGSSRSLRRGKTERWSAGGARSDGGTRNTDKVVERIREKRDNNPHQHEVGEVEDKNQQDRRSAQRDVQEETNRSSIGRKVHRNPGKNPYQQRRGEERETRLPDNGAGKIDRLDRVEEKSVTIKISRKPAKRLEPDEHDRFDRHGNEENLVAHGDRKEEEGDKDETALAGDAEEGHSALNEEGKLPTTESAKVRQPMVKTILGEARKRAANAKSPKIQQIMKKRSTELSNAHFMELCLNQLPITKIMRKTVRYEARLVKPGLDCALEFFISTDKLAESSGNVKTPVSPSSSRNKEKKVAKMQKPVVEKRQEEVGSKYVK